MRLSGTRVRGAPGVGRVSPGSLPWQTLLGLARSSPLLLPQEALPRKAKGAQWAFQGTGLQRVKGRWFLLGFLTLMAQRALRGRKSARARLLPQTWTRLRLRWFQRLPQLQ